MTRLTNARLPDGRRVDLTLQNGRIAAITPHTAPPHTAPPNTAHPSDTDLAGALLLPGLVEGHVHLDKTLMGQAWRPNAPAPSVPGRVAYERAHRAELGPVRPRAMALLARMIAAGTTALRTHTDIDDKSGLANVHGTPTEEHPRGHITTQQVHQRDQDQPGPQLDNSPQTPDLHIPLCPKDTQRKQPHPTDTNPNSPDKMPGQPQLSLPHLTSPNLGTDTRTQHQHGQCNHKA